MVDAVYVLFYATCTAKLFEVQFPVNSCKQYQSGIWIINIVASNDNRVLQYGDYGGHGLMNSS